MTFSWLKRMLPRGLYGRAALILILPVVTLQLVVSVVFLQRHFDGVTRQMTRSMLFDIMYVSGQFEAAPDASVAVREAGAAAAELGIALALPAAGGSGDQRLFYDLSGRVVTRQLREVLPNLQQTDLRDFPTVRLVLTSRHGPLQISFARNRVSASNPHQLLVLMLGTGLLMTLVAYAFLRNQLRPIARLAAAAEAFGKGRVVPYKTRGATEVRSAGAAFLDMRARIERQIEQRTLMLSGISHDLRTPLTRLRLGLSMLPADTDVAAMERDVAEMAQLVDAFLEFARSEAAATEPQPQDVAAFLAAVVDDARRAGQDVTLLKCAATGPATFRAEALRRALENLLANATRYGSRAEVSAQLTARQLRISVEDDGPGIAPERRDEALRPFTRLDPARNQNRGQGVGLGLSIAADIARSHGGSLRLGDSARLGGLKVDLVLAQ